MRSISTSTIYWPSFASSRKFILQKRANLAWLNRFGNKTIADHPRKDQGEPAVDNLFVLVHGVHDGLRRRIEAGNCGHSDRETYRLQMGFDPCNVFVPAEAAAR